MQCRERSRLVRRKAEAYQSPLATFMHGRLQLGYSRKTAHDGSRLPFTRREDYQRIEHTLVEPGGFDECIVAPLNCTAEPPAQTRVERHLVLQVRHSECDMTRLILTRQVRYSPRDRIGTMFLQEAQQIEKRAFAEHREHE
jgi:hypothetical protein